MKNKKRINAEVRLMIGRLSDFLLQVLVDVCYSTILPFSQDMVRRGKSFINK